MHFLTLPQRCHRLWHYSGFKNPHTKATQIRQFFIVGARLRKVRQPFTEAEDDLIVQRRLQGVTYKEIASELDRLGSSVSSRYRLFIAPNRPELPLPPRRRKPDPQLEAIVQRRIEAGEWMTDIAKDLKLSVESLKYDYKLRSGRSSSGIRRVPFTDDELESLEKLRSEGQSCQKIASIMNRTVPSVKHKLRTGGRAKGHQSAKPNMTYSPTTRRRRNTEAVRQQMLDMLHRGMTVNEIATARDRTVRTIRDILGLVVTSYSPTELDLIRREREDNRLSWAEIQKKLPERSKKSLIDTYRYHKRRGRWSKEHKGESRTQELTSA